jgi:anti-anti-sigma factor
MTEVSRYGVVLALPSGILILVESPARENHVAAEEDLHEGDMSPLSPWAEESTFSGTHFGVTSRTRDPYTLITVEGEIDALAEPMFRDLVEKHHHRHLIFDLTHLTFIDSSGLQVLLDAHRRTPTAFCAPTPRILRLFTQLGLLHQIRLYDSVEEALH